MNTISTTHTQESGAVYPYAQAESKETRESNRKWRNLRRKLLVALVWTLIVLAVVFLVLFIASKVGRFESIGDMLYFIQQHFLYSDLFRLS